jgi:hypothetical protein
VLRLCALCALLTGCQFAVRGLPFDHDSDGGLPDLTGIDGIASPDASGPCAPATTRCAGPALETCRLDGTGFDPKPCRFGCGGSPAHCIELEPLGVAQSGDYLVPGIQEVTFGSDVEIDTGTGSISGGFNRPDGTGVINGVAFRVALQGGGAPAAGIFSFKKLTVPAGVTVTFTGANAVVLVSGDDVSISGRIDAQGTCSAGSAGPGGFPGGAGAGMAGYGPGKGTNGAGGNDTSSGGGGAGHAEAGGRGGDGDGNSGGTAGALYQGAGAPAFQLVGGSGGGAGALGNGTFGWGGGGGGAVQIVSAGALSIGFAATLQAGGCGGGGGIDKGGGGGGGSGGAWVLEAERVTLAQGCVLVANGGGGGGADAGQTGVAGRTSTQAAGGGPGADKGTGGGDGGARGSLNGKSATNAMGGIRNGGGGGGAAGRIVMRSRSGAVDTSNITLSPGPGDNAFVVSQAAFE